MAALVEQAATTRLGVSLDELVDDLPHGTQAAMGVHRTVRPSGTTGSCSPPNWSGSPCSTIQDPELV